MNRYKPQRILYATLNNKRCRWYHRKIADIYKMEKLNEDTTVKGWVQTVRKMKGRIFFDVNDGSTFKRLQIVADKSCVPREVRLGSSVEVQGKMLKSSAGQLELHSEQIVVIGDCDLTAGYPFANKRYTPDYMREYISFRPRLGSFGCLFRLRDKISHKIHDYFRKNEFVFCHTPVLTSNDSEGAGEIFKVLPENEELIMEMRKENVEQNNDEVYFNNKAYLTVSGQLHLECLARSLCKVYCFGPTFRAENSKSRFHLSEFYMIEAEVAFVEKLEEILQLMESFIRFVMTGILEEHEEEISVYRERMKIPNLDVVKKVANSNFITLTYDEIFAILQRNSDSFLSPVTEKKALNKEQELFLVHHCGDIPVFIVNWPKDLKPFYMKSSENDDDTVCAVDLLFPNVGELCGGSIREDNYDLLKMKLERSGLTNKLDWYLQLRQFGNVRTGGFGMGFERFLQVMLGTTNIKDTIAFPRWPHNCKY